MKSLTTIWTIIPAHPLSYNRLIKLWRITFRGVLLKCSSNSRHYSKNHFKSLMITTIIIITLRKWWTILRRNIWILIFRSIWRKRSNSMRSVLAVLNVFLRSIRFWVISIRRICHRDIWTFTNRIKGLNSINSPKMDVKVLRLSKEAQFAKRIHRKIRTTILLEAFRTKALTTIRFELTFTINTRRKKRLRLAVWREIISWRRRRNKKNKRQQRYRQICSLNQEKRTIGQQIWTHMATMMDSRGHALRNKSIIWDRSWWISHAAAISPMSMLNASWRILPTGISSSPQISLKITVPRNHTINPK